MSFDHKKYIAEELVKNPVLSYQEVATNLGLLHDIKITRAGVARIAQIECPKLQRRWKKKNPLPKQYTCQKVVEGRKCGKKFKGERGYSGQHARFCREHRTGKHSS